MTMAGLPAANYAPAGQNHGPFHTPQRGIFRRLALPQNLTFCSPDDSAAVADIFAPLAAFLRIRRQGLCGM
jgi:hypothetical protein